MSQSQQKCKNLPTDVLQTVVKFTLWHCQHVNCFLRHCIFSKQFVTDFNCPNFVTIKTKDEDYNAVLDVNKNIMILLLHSAKRSL